MNTAQRTILGLYYDFWKMSYNSLIFGLIGMKLYSCILILNTNVVKFKEIENVEKKSCQILPEYVVKFKEAENVEIFFAKFCLSWEGSKSVRH